MSVYVFPAPRGDDQAAAAAMAAGQRAEFATVGAAAAAVEDGQSVYVQPGSYPHATVSRRFIRPTTIRGGAGIVAGMTFDGAENVTLLGVQSSYLVHVNNSRGIRLSGNVITDPAGGAGVKISGSMDVMLNAVTIHDSGVGIVGSSLNDSRRVTIQDCTLTGFVQDAIQATHWHDVWILRNHISEVCDPDGYIHNDGIQTAGDATNWIIADNVISGIRGQGMLLQRTQTPFGPFTISGNTIDNHPLYHSLILSGAPGNRVFANRICTPRSSAGVQTIAAYGAEGATLEVYDNVLCKPWKKMSEPLDVLRDENNMAC